MSRKERGSSRPPLSENALDLSEANRELTAVLSGLIRPRHMPSGELQGRQAWEILSDMLFDATAVRRWRSEADAGKPTNLRACLDLCRLMAGVLAERRGPDYRLPRVVTTPKRAAELLAERGEQAKNPNREAPKVRKITARDSYRAMVRDMECWVEAGTHSKEGAKAAKADELGCSIWRVRDAIKFVNTERDTVFGGYEDGDDAA